MLQRCQLHQHCLPGTLYQYCFLVKFSRDARWARCFRRCRAGRFCCFRTGGNWFCRSYGHGRFRIDGACHRRSIRIRITTNIIITTTIPIIRLLLVATGAFRLTPVSSQNVVELIKLFILGKGSIRTPLVGKLFISFLNNTWCGKKLLFESQYLVG